MVAGNLNSHALKYMPSTANWRRWIISLKYYMSNVVLSIKWHNNSRTCFLRCISRRIMNYFRTHLGVEIQSFTAFNIFKIKIVTNNQIYRCGTSTKAHIISCPHFQAIWRMCTRGPITHANCSGKCHEKF